MSFRRSAVMLLAAPALLLSNLALAQLTPEPSAQYSPGRAREPVLPGTNSISNPVLQQMPDGHWKVTFDYFYTGQPEDVGIFVEQMASTGAQNDSPVSVLGPPVMPQHGQHRMTRDVQRPGEDRLRVTREVRVEFRTFVKPSVLVSATVSRQIEWPDQDAMAFNSDLATLGVEGVVKKAVALIDEGTEDSLGEARALLERLIQRHPDADAAYLEMARVAMKTNWNPEGLHQAETLIKSALQIRPDSANARILLGYVYAYQHRYTESEAQFSAAAVSHPRNLWLWENWGELLDMQGRKDAAARKYQEAISRPPTGDTYDRARLAAYERLLETLSERHDVDGMESLYRKRSEEYAGKGCSSVLYAQFLVQERGDTARAIELLRANSATQCAPAQAREVLGLAYYVQWASSKGVDGAMLLNQARVLLPVGPRVLVGLAASDRTVAAVRRLVQDGERIDQVDGRGMNALAYALAGHATDAAERLVRLGARTDTLLGPENMPIALVPVLTHDAQGVRLMMRSGVDYRALHYQGSSGFEIARKTGDAEVLKAIEPEKKVL